MLLLLQFSSALSEAVADFLGYAADGQGIRRNISSYRGACGDKSTAADRYRSDELSITTYENVIFNHRAMFVITVVVARNDACPDVYLLSYD